MSADPGRLPGPGRAGRCARGLRAWGIEGTGGYGAGLTRFLRERGEWVIELDRPTRTARHHGAKSDPLDAMRPAREALARAQLAEPRQGAARGDLAVLLTARRSAIDGVTVAQRQLHALVVAAPEPLRARFRGTTAHMLARAARLRADARWGRRDAHCGHTAAGLAHWAQTSGGC